MVPRIDWNMYIIFPLFWQKNPMPAEVLLLSDLSVQILLYPMYLSGFNFLDAFPEALGMVE